MVLIGLALARTKLELAERQIPLMGIMAAFIFAAQMINFPVAGGTSGHLLGGVLAAITLGPWPAMLVMASVIGLQALLFQDGGLVSMGANILNMGLITVLIGYGVFHSVAGRARRVRLIAAAFAAWLSVLAGALLTSIQLWLSSTAALDIVIRAMLAVHAVIGLGEALITAAALGFILRTRADIIERSTDAPAGKGWVAAGVTLSALVLLLAPMASTDPDGLERVAEDLGFLGLAVDTPYVLFPDYSIPFLGDTQAATILAGAMGALLVGTLALLLARVLLQRRSRTRDSAD